MAVQTLVLLGGGHSHAIALKLLKLPASVRLILISDVLAAPYSGMIPGYIAGLYRHRECHIDLVQLARWAGADLIHDRAVGLDLAQKLVLCAGGNVPFDWLSINIGSTPQVAEGQGIAVKPIPQFLEAWQQLLTSDRPLKIAIVGGGIGGIELALAMRFRTGWRVELWHRGSSLRAGMEQLLQQRGIKTHLHQNIATVTALINQNGQNFILHSSSGAVECDRLFWVTNAVAPPWLQQAGLQTDDAGFLAIDHTLRSLSHPYIFGTGDIATIKGSPRPKAGVFAVRQGKPLAHNLQKAILGQPLQPYYPQKQHLALVGTGDQQAIALWGNWQLGQPFCHLLWQWKERIDRQFMAQFAQV